MKIEGNFNSKKQEKLNELRAQIKNAEANENEGKVILLEAELRAIEKDEVFNHDEFLAEQARKKEDEERLKNRKHNILRNMQAIPSYTRWTYDGIEGTENYRHSYEYTFKNFLRNVGVQTFQQFIDKKSEKLERKVKILDLFGGAYFIKDLKNVSQITGVRLHNVDQELLEETADEPNARDYLKSLINNKKRNLILGNLYKSETWREIEKDNIDHGGNGFDLIVCRPEGPFRNTDDQSHSIEGISDTGLTREKIFVSLLERTLKLLSEDGILFAQTPNLKTNFNIAKKFWEEYVTKKELEGYKFMFDKNQLIPDEAFVVMRSKA